MKKYRNKRGSGIYGKCRQLSKVHAARYDRETILNGICSFLDLFKNAL